MNEYLKENKDAYAVVFDRLACLFPDFDHAENYFLYDRWDDFMSGKIRDESEYEGKIVKLAEAATYCETFLVMG